MHTPSIIFHDRHLWQQKSTLLPTGKMSANTYSDEISSLIGGVSRGTVNEESLSRLRNHLEGLLFRLRDYSPGRGPFRREVRRAMLEYVEPR